MYIKLSRALVEISNNTTLLFLIACSIQEIAKRTNALITIRSLCFLVICINFKFHPKHNTLLCLLGFNVFAITQSFALTLNWALIFILNTFLLLFNSLIATGPEKKTELLTKETDVIQGNNSMLLDTIKDEINTALVMNAKIMEQLAPKNILNSIDERYSSYSVMIPTTSLTTISVLLNHINHLAEHVGNYRYHNHPSRSANSLTLETNATNNFKHSFKFGSIIQIVCDTLTGIAITKNVEIVIHNNNQSSVTDAIVSGNREKFRHLLINLLSNVIMSCNEDSAIELLYEITQLNENTASDSIKDRDLCQIDFEIYYSPANKLSEKSGFYPDANLLDRMVHDLKGAFTSHELNVDNNGSICIKLTFVMPLIKLTDFQATTFNPNSNEKINKILSDESQTLLFIQLIRGQKFLLYSNEYSNFAQRLSSSLVNWGVEVLFQSISKKSNESNKESEKNKTLNFKVASLVIINDHLETLENHLSYIATEFAAMSPSCFFATNIEFASYTKAPLVFFASLSNYQKVKDSIQGLLNKPNSFFFPPILVIPKPCGPMRILTNLYTALNREPVCSPFIPNSSPHGMHYTYDRDIHQENIKGLMLNNRGRRGNQSYSNKNFNLYMMSSNNYKSPSDYFSIKNNVFSVSNSNNTKQDLSVVETKSKTPVSSPKVRNAMNKNEDIRAIRKTSLKKEILSASFPPIKVLIVEDNPINLTILSTFMKKRNIKYDIAKNGQHALDKWKEGSFDLVFMDIQLPVLDGIEVTKIIRNTESCRKISTTPLTLNIAEQNMNIRFNSVNEMNADSENQRAPVIIVALTASSSNTDRNVALAAGCNDFLTKPVSLKWLEKKIIEWGSMQALINFESWKKWKTLNVDGSAKSQYKPEFVRTLSTSKLEARKSKIKKTKNI